MATVTINTGPITAQSSPDEVPFEDWPSLVRARASFGKVRIPYDCRELLVFVDDARKYDMVKRLGYADEEDFIRRGLEMDPETVALALATLERMKPIWAMPFREAVTIARKGEYGRGRPKDRCDNVTSKRGNSETYTLARLDRDHPELAAQVRSKALTAHAAAIRAGFRKRMVSVPTEDLTAAIRILARHYTPTAIEVAARSLHT